MSQQKFFRLPNLILYYIVFVLLAPQVAFAQFDPTNPDSWPRFGYQTWQSAKAGTDYVANELIVVFEPSQFVVRFDDPALLDDAAVAQLHAEVQALAQEVASTHGLELLDTSPIGHGALLAIPNQSADPHRQMLTLLRRLERSDQRIRFVEPNGYRHTTETQPVTDPNYINQYWHYTVVGASRAWDTIPWDFRVRVAVIDTGFRYDHPDASPGMMPADDFDFVRRRFFIACNGSFLLTDMDLVNGPDNDATDNFQFTTNAVAGCTNAQGDTLSHGTHVAGTIASAWENTTAGVGMIGRIELGLSSNFEMVPIRALDTRGSGTFWDITQAVYYAGGLPASDGNGGTVSMPRAHIVNMSYGSTFLSIFELVAVASTFSQDTLMIAAAGNGGGSTPPNPGAPSFPAAYGHVVAVSNVQPDGAGGFVLSPTSSAYPGVELAAPGTGVRSISYNYTGCNAIIGIICDASAGGATSNTDASGTSMASPHVAGVAALYLAHNPTFTGIQLRTALTANAFDLGPVGIDNSFGSGLVQTAPGPNGVQLVTNRTLPHVLLVNALTGAVLQDVIADVFGNYTFLAVPPGDYILVGAHDEDTDGVLGETGEAVGAPGGDLQRAPRFTQFALGNVVGNLTAGTASWPDQEPELANDTMAGASDLFVGFYAVSTYVGADEDWFRVLVPADGDYRIWTEGRNTTLCQTDGLEYDTFVELYDAAGGIIDQNNDAALDPGILWPNVGIFLVNRCSEIQQTLTAGTYYVRVTAQNPGSAVTGAQVIVRFDPV